jgi:hypothetical protein
MVMNAVGNKEHQSDWIDDGIDDCIILSAISRKHPFEVEIEFCCLKCYQFAVSTFTVI